MPDCQIALYKARTCTQRSTCNKDESCCTSDTMLRNTSTLALDSTATCFPFSVKAVGSQHVGWLLLRHAKSMWPTNGIRQLQCRHSTEAAYPAACSGEARTAQHACVCSTLSSSINRGHAHDINQQNRVQAAYACMGDPVQHGHRSPQTQGTPPAAATATAVLWQQHTLHHSHSLHTHLFSRQPGNGHTPANPHVLLISKG